LSQIGDSSPNTLVVLRIDIDEQVRWRGKKAVVDPVTPVERALEPAAGLGS
jgi:hypothetical protein